MKNLYRSAAVACLLLSALLTGSAAAYNQPLPLNLGFTSFMDGAPPAGPGWYFTEYIGFITADKFPDGPPVAANAKVDAWISLNQFIYQSDTPVLLGGKWGLDVIVPFVHIDATDRNGLLTDNGGGLSDIYVGPYLQWDPIMGEKGPIFMHRVEFQMIFPTGKYDNDKVLNPGSNLFSFDPYWAGTYFFTPRLTASWRLHYLWNAENDDPFQPPGPIIDEIQPGQAFHANFAASYEVIPQQLRVGVNGYYLEQLTDTEAEISGIGTVELDDDESVFAIGPGALWSLSKDTHLFFNAYFETNVDYRPEGERFILRLVHHF